MGKSHLLLIVACNTHMYLQVFTGWVYRGLGLSDWLPEPLAYLFRIKKGAKLLNFLFSPLAHHLPAPFDNPLVQKESCF